MSILMKDTWHQELHLKAGGKEMCVFLFFGTLSAEFPPTFSSREDSRLGLIASETSA